jgi:hypothetical protein
MEYDTEEDLEVSDDDGQEENEDYVAFVLILSDSDEDLK